VSAYDFVSPAPRSLDELETEVIVLPFFLDERPLCGAAGILDWRLCGALSRKLMAGYLDGRFGEKALLATPPTLKSDALLLFGLGPSTEFEDLIAKRACAQIVETLVEARVSNAALVLPGRSMELLPALDAMQLWLDANAYDLVLEEVIIIERIEEHRALDSFLDGLRRQAESPLD